MVWARRRLTAGNARLARPLMLIIQRSIEFHLHPVTTDTHILMQVTCCVIRLGEWLHYKMHKLLGDERTERRLLHYAAVHYGTMSFSDVGVEALQKKTFLHKDSFYFW